MKRIVVATIFTLIALSAYGQTQTTASGISPCTLKLAQSPAVRGVKLGMKIEDVLAMFPGSAERDQIKSVIENVDGYPSFGVTTVYVNPWEYSTKDRFNGIDDFSFIVLDDRVVKYRVDYASPPKGPSWRNVNDFVARVAGLPPIGGGRSGRSNQACSGKPYPPPPRTFLPYQKLTGRNQTIAAHP